MRAATLFVAPTVVATAALALLGGCFDPQFQAGFTCGDPSTGPACPDGFECAADLTCQPTSGASPAALAGEHLIGMAAARPALTRLGHGAMLVASIQDSTSSPTFFRAHRLDASGASTSHEGLSGFDGYSVDPMTLVAAGNDAVAVAAGIGGADTLALAWVTPTGLQEETGSAQGPLTAFASPAGACVAGYGLNGDLIVRCGTGGASSPVPVSIGGGLAVRSVAGALSEMTINDFVLAWEVSAGAQSELFVKCPRQAVPSAPLITETPPSGGLLGPQLFYAARAGVMVLAYQTASGFHDVSIEPTTCAATGAPSSVEALDAFGLAITGPLPGVGGSATLGRLFLQKDTAGAHVAAYGALRPTASTTVVRGETGAISGAVGVTDGTGQPLLFYFAADPSGAGPGIVRGAEALVAAWDGSPVTVSRAAVEPDFAVASRQDGGAFVAYRAAGTGTTSAVYVRAIDGSGQGLQP